MICTRCKQEKGTPGRGISLQKNGHVLGVVGIVNYDAVCNDCMRAIDNTSRTVGEDDDKE